MGTEKLRKRGVTYDVICIYIKKMLQRFEKYFPQLTGLIADIKCGVPAFHANAHRNLCQVGYGLCYAEGFGNIRGEWVETPWAELNIAGLLTCKMSAGARHDALNDLFNHWNCVKLECSCKFPSIKI